MKRPTLYFSLLAGLLCLPSLAQQPAAALPQPEIQASADRLAVARAAIEKQRGERIAAAKAWYTATLDKLQKDVTAKGDLDGVLAVKSELGRMDRELTPEERGAMPEGVRVARGNYERLLAQVADQAAAGEIAALTAQMNALEAVQKRLTQAGNIDGALKVKLERTMIAEQIGGLEKTRKLPATAAPAVAAEAVKAAPVARPPGFAPAAAMGTAAVVNVADEIRTKGGIKGAAAGVISFDAPAGNGRRGAKGLLIKNDPQTGKNGTTWSFTYTRGGTANGLQIIHPHIRGQVMVNLNKTGVNVSVPDNWSEVGWGPGHSKTAVRMTRDADTIFPLVDDTEYQVESKVTASGGVELSINGKLVATGRASGASPLVLENPNSKKNPDDAKTSGFSGADLPMKWEVGYAGLLVGPMDGGQNMCRQVKFQASALPAR